MYSEYGPIQQLDYVMMTVQCGVLLADIRQGLSEGRGPFQTHDVCSGNRTMHIPQAVSELVHPVN